MIKTEAYNSYIFDGFKLMFSFIIQKCTNLWLKTSWIMIYTIQNLKLVIENELLLTKYLTEF